MVNIKEAPGVAVVDAETAAVTNTWPISSVGPHGLDLDIRRDRAFVACDGGDLVCLGLTDGFELARVGIAGEPDAIWFHDAVANVYVAVGSPGVIQVVDTTWMKVSQIVETETGAKTTALDHGRQVLYVFKPTSCSLAAFQIS